MKDLLRRNTSLTEDMEKALNDQIRVEARSSAQYLAMASWCDQKGFVKSAEFLYNQSDEERTHMMKIFRYVNDRGGKAISPEISGIGQEFDSFRAVFEDMLDQEISVSQSIHRLMDQARQEKDFTTDKFLEWFIEEQKEEEATARRALELFDIIGEEGTGKFEIDRQIGKLTNYEGEA